MFDNPKRIPDMLDQQCTGIHVALNILFTLTADCSQSGFDNTSNENSSLWDHQVYAEKQLLKYK